MPDAAVAPRAGRSRWWAHCWALRPSQLKPKGAEMLLGQSCVLMPGSSGEQRGCRRGQRWDGADCVLQEAGYNQWAVLCLPDAVFWFLRSRLQTGVKWEMLKHIPCPLLSCLPGLHLPSALFAKMSVETLCSKLCIYPGLGFPTRCLTATARLGVPEPPMCGGWSCLPFGTRRAHWCCLTIYYPKRCIMRRFDLCKTLRWCNTEQLHIITSKEPYNYCSVSGGALCVLISKVVWAGGAVPDPGAFVGGLVL